MNKLNNLQHLIRTTAAKLQNYNSKYHNRQLVGGPCQILVPSERPKLYLY